MTLKLPALIASLAEDCMAAYSIPGASTGAMILGEGIECVFRKRTETAREVLLDELRKGQKRIEDIESVDEAAAMFYRYSRAAQEGAARLNLRLMAKIIAGQAHIGNLIADEFLYYADVLASLRREEVILIATLHRCKLQSETGAVSDVWEDAQSQLIPDLFENRESMLATTSAAARTGLLRSDNMMDGWGLYISSPLMDRLETLAPFDEALRTEGIWPIRAKTE